MISLKEIDLIGINSNSFGSITYNQTLPLEGESMSDSDFLNKLLRISGYNAFKVLRLLNNKNIPLYNTQISKETGIAQKDITSIMDFLKKYRLTTYTRDIDPDGRTVYNMITMTGKTVVKLLEEINKEVYSAPYYKSGRMEDYIEYLIKDAYSELIGVDVSFISKRKNMMITKMKCNGKNFYSCTHSTCEAIIKGIAENISKNIEIKPTEFDGKKCVFKVIF